MTTRTLNTYRRPAEQARERIAGARQRISALQRAFQEELHQARSFTHPDYTSEGLGNRRQELEKQVREKYAPQLADLQGQVQRDQETISEWATPRRPGLGEDAVALQRAQVKWDQARMRLEAGMSWQQLVSTADLDTLVAVQEWGPSWLDAQAFKDSPGSLREPTRLPDPSALQRALTARFLEVGDDDTRWALQAQADAEVAAGGFEPMAAHVKGQIEGYKTATTGLGAVIESHYGAQMAAPGYGGLTDDGDDGEAA